MYISAFIQNEQENYYEISICPEFMDRSIYDICATLLHEMVHLWNLQNDIQDCSRGNTYHNKKFKKVAEEHGLIINYDKRIGWSLTKLQPTTKEFINLHNDLKLIPLIRRSAFKQIYTGSSKVEDEQDDVVNRSIKKKRNITLELNDDEFMQLGILAKDLGLNKGRLLELLAKDIIDQEKTSYAEAWINELKSNV